MDKINTMEDFAKIVKFAFAEKFPGCKVDVASITKNNGLCLTGVTARLHHTDVVPTVYLEPYFSNLQSGGSLYAVIGEIISSYNAALKDAEKTNAAEISDFSSAKNKICYRLVNKELNSKLLSTMPHRDFLDLAIIYCIQLASDDGSVKTVKVTDILMELWSVDEAELYRLACKNTPKLNRGCVMPLDNMLGGILGLPSSTGEDTKHFSYNGFDITLGSGNGLPIYIATNATQVNGASVILYDGLLETIAEKIGSFFVLPSSIHECLLVPGNPKDAGSMSKMVREVNCTEVREDEILSDSCFYYNATAHNIEIIIS